MDGRYEISQLLEAAFGIKAGFYITQPIIAQRPPVLQPYSATMKLEQVAQTRQSWLGTPIMFPMQFIGGANLRMFDEQGKVVRERFDDWDLPAATLVDFGREKVTIETQVSGGYGTVKEMYSFGDWDIRIRGLCLDEPGVRTAQQQKKALLMWERVCESVEVAGQLFDDVLVFKMMIKKLTFRQLEGKPWVIAYEMECLSDNDTDLLR